MRNFSSAYRGVWHRSSGTASLHGGDMVDLACQPLDEGQRKVTACFTGHRRPDSAHMTAYERRLTKVMQELYRRGYRVFICGGALGFDTIAAHHVLKLQTLHADVRLVLAIPCAEQTRYWQDADIDEYRRIRYAADEVRVLSPFYFSGCMQVRDRWMVDRSSFCVCLLEDTASKGGTIYTVSYAVRHEVPVLNIAILSEVRRFTADDAG